MSDKKYYWLKLPRGFFKRHDIRILSAASKDYALFYLKLLCESIDHNGYLRFSEKVPYTADMLAVITDTNPDTARCALQVLISLGLVIILDDGTYWLTDVDKMIGSEGESAERTRKYRERLAEQKALPSHCDAAVTTCDDGVTERKSKSIEIDIEEQGIESKEVIMSDGLTEEKKESKSAGACGYAYAPAIECLEENKQALEEFLFVCDVTVSDVFQDQDRPTQERLGHFLADLGKSLACKRTVLIEGQEVPVADVLDYFRAALETGEPSVDEMLVATIREVNKKVIDGKVRGNQEGYLVSALYGRIKAGGAV